jgi:hypothetical protein
MYNKAAIEIDCVGFLMNAVIAINGLYMRHATRILLAILEVDKDNESFRGDKKAEGSQKHSGVDRESSEELEGQTRRHLWSWDLDLRKKYVVAVSSVTVSTSEIPEDIRQTEVR